VQFALETIVDREVDRAERTLDNAAGDGPPDGDDW
jgi:hypothetical protein